MSLKTDYDHLVQRLKTERDQLNLRIHLAEAELRDEWEELEQRWNSLQSKGRQLRKAADENADEIAAAAQKIGDELKKGYRRIKQRLH